MVRKNSPFTTFQMKRRAPLCVAFAMPVIALIGCAPTVTPVSEEESAQAAPPAALDASAVFALRPLPDVEVPISTSKKIQVDYLGRPQFPVVMAFTLAECSREGACTPSVRTFNDPASPITVRLRCWGRQTGSARWRVVLRDAAGSTTAPAEFVHTCYKPDRAGAE